MIQRIQSIWLLLASLCSCLLFFLPLASTPEHALFFVYGWADHSNSNLWALALACTLLPLPVIFQYRKRPRQIRMVGLVGILNLVLAILSFVEIRKMSLYNFSPAVLLIPASIVFLILAIIAISKDEKLVRSSDRLR